MTRPPNILFLTDDQHRWDFFPWTGAAPSLQAPNLDRLRREGVAFMNGWSNCPICVPTRFTWCHGLYASQGRAGLLTNASPWPTDLPSLPGALRGMDYRTALIGKLHAHGQARDLTTPEMVERTRARGFDHVWEVCGRSMAHHCDCNWTQHLRARGVLDAYRKDVEARRAHLCWNETYRPSILDETDQVDSLIADHAVDWLRREGKKAGPFFLHASFCGPHFPLDPPPCYFDRYRPESMPAPVGVEDPAERQYWQEQRAAYCALIEFTDYCMGRVLTALDALGLAEKTLVIFSTDHGDRIGDQTSYHKGQPQDGSCRTPVLARWPGRLPAGATRDGFVTAVDIPATCLQAAGLAEPLEYLLPNSPGRSFLDYARDGGEPSRSRAYAETGMWRMVVDERWKYVWRAEGEMLFDRVADPHDLQNLAEDPARADDLAAMRLALIEEMYACVAPSEPGHFQARDARKQTSRATRDATDKIPRRPSRPV